MLPRLAWASGWPFSAALVNQASGATINKNWTADLYGLGYARAHNPAPKYTPRSHIVIFQLLITVLLAATFSWADAGTLGGSALIGLLAWIAFAVPTIGLTLLFELRSVTSHVIGAGHTLISFVVKGAIIGWWPWGGAPGA